ncbi:hypothetical protein ONZ51_g13253 [Trametes cubensis]|uniref:Steroid 5-alpha reductase C-terminal domain-containing protein n=1 Tax=Trametes cubensis TaxID=1111947 RepID=A0AAD7TFP3_9APHY|nr:hypothetical protein ONZ51_g13253 [Trametes cubensis]
MPLFSKLAPSIISAFGLQSALALIFVPQANEKFYDLGGSIGFISTTLVSLYYPHLKAKYWDRIPGRSLPRLLSLAPRQLFLNAAILAWSTRLGSFLFARALKAGGDSRFDEVKHQPAKFTAFWMAQATWVLAVGLPVYMVNTLPPANHARLGPLDFIGIALWAGSWLFEIVADHQKSAWRRAKENKEHDDKFITTGLWGISRHPNYVGEVGLWTGMWLVSGGSLRSPFFPKGAWLLAGLSPLLTWFLLTRVSGVPPLEAAGDKKFGNDPKWQEYKRTCNRSGLLALVPSLNVHVQVKACGSECYIHLVASIHLTLKFPSPLRLSRRARSQYASSLKQGPCQFPQNLSLQPLAEFPPNNMASLGPETPAELAVKNDFQTHIWAVFQDLYEDKWDQGRWNASVARFRAAHDPAVVQRFWTRAKLPAWDALEAQFRKGPPPFLRPGWQSPLLGKRVDLQWIDRGPFEHVKGSTEGWRNAKILIIEFWAS